VEVSKFLDELLIEIEALDFVENVQLQVEEVIVKGRINLQNSYFVQIYFNSKRFNLTFALIVNKERKWGIDCNKIQNWHRHPLENPATHQKIKSKSIKEIVQELKEVWMKIHTNNTNYSK